MANDSPPSRITANGCDEVLTFEADEALASPANVTFTATYTDAQNAAQTSTWMVQLPVEPLAAPPATPGRQLMQMKWRVAFGTPANAPPRYDLTYKVTGKGAATGALITASQVNPLHVDRIELTTEPKLTRIMLHEFSKLKNAGDSNNPNDYEFAPDSAQAYIDGLAAEQKKLLLGYDVSAHNGNRLVVLITFQPNNDRRMAADFCEHWPTRVLANASFAVFHCKGPGNGCTLVCYTEHFLVNLRNPETQSLVHSLQGKRRADEWMRKNTLKPVMFKIGCLAPAHGSHWVLYNRILNPDGTDVMAGNTMHGMINTVGCWMLFRNYNWPRARFNQLCDIFTQTCRQEFIALSGDEETSNAYKYPLTHKKLDDAGYNAPETSQEASSFDKFVEFDRNYAFLWFFHEIVGVKYLAPYFGQIKARLSQNDYNNHGQVDLTTIPLSQANKPPPFNDPDEKNFCCYEVKQRHKIDPHFKVDDSLWRTNALNFRASSTFASWALHQAVPKAQVNSCTWADMYMYAEDGLEVRKLTANY